MSHTTHYIEQATAADHDELTALWEASVRATHDFITEADIQFHKAAMPTYLQAVQVFVIRDAAGHIRGFLGTSADKIEMLFIHPEHRSGGIGRALLAFAIQENGIKKVEVNEQNAQAVGFYRHCGFHVTGRSELDSTGKPYPILFMEFSNQSIRQL